MDKSHVCLCDINISSNWFTKYVNTKLCVITVDSTQFALLLNYGLKHDKIELKYNDTNETHILEDKLFIHFLNEKDKINEVTKGKNVSFDHFFELTLVDTNQEELAIPKVDYDAEVCMETKKWVELLVELNSIGPNLTIICRENDIEMQSSSEHTKLTVNIPIDDLQEYSVTEDENIEMSFSLNHLSKMCSSGKLSTNVFIGISKEYPMLVRYDLGDNSEALFYVAPKIID